MEKEGYSTANIYQGGYSSLSSDHGELFTGYRANSGSIGMATVMNTANLLKEVTDKISSGAKVIEATMVSPEIMEAIPKQHLKEVKRLAELTGVEVTVHGPVVETSGLNAESGFSETNRKVSERRMYGAIERSVEMNPKGLVPVTFHTTEGIPGTTYKKTEEGEVVPERLMIADKDTGQLMPLEQESRWEPGGEKIRKEIHSAEEQLGIVNNTKWSNGISAIEFNREHAVRILKDIHPTLVADLNHRMVSQEGLKEVSPQEQDSLQKMFSAKEYLDQASLSARALFDKAYKSANKNEKEYLEVLSKQYGKDLSLTKDGGQTEMSINPQVQSQAIFNLTSGLEKIRPELYEKAENFAIDKSSETFSNLALQSYQQFKDKSPIISIENPPASGFGLSSGDDLRNLIVKSREKFVEKSVKKGILSESEARKKAEQIIGATWDVGHINQMRRFGFDAADVVKETEKIAPYLKHVHLSDNFGMENTELPMGMGNVPLKEIMEKLGKKGKDAKKIIEAAHWWQHFQSSPMAESLEAVGSPMYSMQMGPYWNQKIGLQQGYSEGAGMMLPTFNYETFGAGFSGLPAELGGSRQGGGQSRMSGRPME